MNKNYLFSLVLILLLSSCVVGGVNQITSIEFVEKKIKTVAKGENPKVNSKLLVVCYNRFFNEGTFGKTFNLEYNLDTINYKKEMLVEIFLESKPNVNRTIGIDKIVENRDFIKVYYLLKEKESELSNSPFIIVQTDKSKKPIKFFENGTEVLLNTQKAYIKN